MLTTTSLARVGSPRVWARAGRLRRPVTTPPRASTSILVGAAVTLSTIPSLLPRAPLAQGLLTGALVLLALAALGVSRRVAASTRSTRAGRIRLPPAPSFHGATSSVHLVQWVALAGAVCGVAGTAAVAQFGVTRRATDLAMVAPGPAYWLVAGAWALAVVALGLAVAAGARRLVRSTWRRPGPHTGKPRTPRSIVVTLLAGVTVTSAASGPIDLLEPLRKTMDPHHVLLKDSPVGASRSFALVGETETPEAAAALAAQQMVTDGGLDRDAILIALPTGSGWVNADAVTAIETQLDGDVAVVSAQYGDLPSWWSFLIDQEPAVRSAQALVDEVLERVSELPADERPDVYLHGESLGALAGQAAVAGVDQEAICGMVWSGAPGGALSGHPRERSLRNPDDPVTYLSTETALSQPDGWPTTWLPGLSYGTTVLDLGASLLPDAGHGHVYGPEQDWTLPTC